MRDLVLLPVIFGLSSACLSGFGGGGGCCGAQTASCGNPCGSYASAAVPQGHVDQYPLAPPSPLSVPFPAPVQSIPSNAYAVAPQQPAPFNQGGLFQDPSSIFGRPMLPIIPMPGQIQPIPLYGHPTSDTNNYAPQTQQQIVPASQGQNLQPEQIYRGSGGYSTGPNTAVEESGIGYKNAGSATAVVVEEQYKDKPAMTSVAEPGQTVVKVGTEIDTTVGGSDYSDVLEHKKQIQVIKENEQKVKQNLKPVAQRPDGDENPDAGSDIDSTDGGAAYDQVEEGEVPSNDGPTGRHGTQTGGPGGHSTTSVKQITVQVVPSGPVPQPPVPTVSKNVGPSLHGDSHQVHQEEEEDQEETIVPQPAVVKAPTGGLDFKETQQGLTTEKPRSTIPGVQSQPEPTPAPTSSDFAEDIHEQPEAPTGETEIHTSNTVIQPAVQAPAKISHSNEELGDGTDYDNEASVGPLPNSNDVITGSGSSSSSSTVSESKGPSGSNSDSASGNSGPVQIPLVPAEEITEEAEEPEQNLASSEAEDISKPSTGTGFPGATDNVSRIGPKQSAEEEDALAEAISSEAAAHPTTPGASNTGNHATSSESGPAPKDDRITVVEVPHPITPVKPAVQSVVGPSSDVSQETDGSDYDTVPEDRPDVPTHPTVPTVAGTPTATEERTQHQTNVPSPQSPVPSNDNAGNHGEIGSTLEERNPRPTSFNGKPSGPAEVPVSSVSDPKTEVPVPTPSHPEPVSTPTTSNQGMIPFQPQPLTVSHEVKPTPAHKEQDENQEIVEPQETQGTDYSAGAEYDDVKPNAVEHTAVIVNSEDEKKENRNELAVEYNGQRAAGTVQLTQVDPISKYTDELISLRKLKRSQRA